MEEIMSTSAFTQGNRTTEEPGQTIIS